MNSAEVKDALILVKGRLARAKAEVKKVHADWDAIREMCDHEGMSLTTHMGERCRHCFDCETCDV